jgi:hypothetical protein
MVPPVPGEIATAGDVAELEWGRWYVTGGLHLLPLVLSIFPEGESGEDIDRCRFGCRPQAGDRQPPGLPRAVFGDRLPARPRRRGRRDGPAANHLSRDMPMAD